MISYSILFIEVILSLFLVVKNQYPKIDSFHFEHHYIAHPLPGESWGTGAFTLADFDKDGDLDITISRRTTSMVYWYEFKGTDQWIQHIIGPSDGRQLGGLTTDVNEDGFNDLVMGRIWFKNPGMLAENPDVPWHRYQYAGGLETENHDIGTADFDLDGRKEIISYSQDANNGTLRLYNTTNQADWSYLDISTQVNSLVSDRDKKGIHAGFAPNGVGDLDGDDDPDIVMPTGWFENPANGGTRWRHNAWPFQVGNYPNSYGTSIRSWVIDLNNDGLNDVIYSDTDVKNSNVYLIMNSGDNTFSRQQLPSPSDSTGSFHSLAVADFDNDGDSDIFVGEQEDTNPLMKPDGGLKERGILYENISNDRKMQFRPVIIHTDNPGWHDTRAGDVDGDGDIDLVTKVWNKDGEHYHADFWENKLID